jgi:hypothetical protein
MSNFKSNPENYRRNLEPFQSKEEAQKNLALFAEAVSNARNQYNIADVLIVVKDSMVHEGEEENIMTVTHFGAQTNVIIMAAYAYGRLLKEQEELLNNLIQHK